MADDIDDLQLVLSLCRQPPTQESLSNVATTDKFISLAWLIVIKSQGFIMSNDEPSINRTPRVDCRLRTTKTCFGRYPSTVVG